MRITTKLWIGSLTLGAVAGLWGCNDNLTCGSGTIEHEGECIGLVGDAGPPGGSCGAGSKYDPTSGMCIVDFCNADGICGICGDNTVATTNDAGVPTCIGTGTGPGTDCTQDLPCTDPASGKFMICG